MKDQRIEKVADIIIDYSLKPLKGEKIAIRSPYIAEPLVLALYERLIDSGAHAIIRAEMPTAHPLYYSKSSDEQLKYIWEPTKWYIENLDAQIDILADHNTRYLSRVDPDRRVIASQARKDLINTSMRRTAEGEFRWTLTLFPTEAFAMEAEMSLPEYEDFYFGACLLNEPDPVKAWEEVAARHARLIEWMQGRKEVHIEGEGTDLYLDVTDRTWVPADGNMNLPDGEIFTGPVENGTRGHISFSFPAIFYGVSVLGARLEFEEGRVVDATADKNEEYLIKTLDTDAGGRIVGELGIGTNYGIKDFTGEILMDEKIGGTVHIAMGASYPETGGKNESSVHWDMVCDLRKGGRISVDGDTLMEDGKLVV
jgi:aminopeptidase